MLTLTNLHSPEAAVRYFRTELTQDNSRLLRSACAGNWLGDGAKLLSLAGTVTSRDFGLLLRLKSPSTGRQLRPRSSKKSCTDICYSASKSVSIMSMIDSRIQPLVASVVGGYIDEIAGQARVRDRRGDKAQRDLTTPSRKIIAALFSHSTSRENDPDLHCHLILGTFKNQFE